MKLNHFVGGILLVSGTTIGAGMLALPVMTSFCGFFPALSLLFICFAVMFLTANYFLDVNLSFSENVNFISMADARLGSWAKWLCWIFYLLLLYSLAAAYIAGSAPLFTLGIKTVFGIEISKSLSFFCLPVLFGIFVYFGCVGVDFINRFLMAALAISYVILVSTLPTKINPDLLLHFDLKPSLLALLVVITSFGYHIIIPSLTGYMFHNRRHLRLTLLIGSLIPLVIYVFWEAVTLGIVPIEGENGLANAWIHGTGVSIPLSNIVQSPYLKVGVNFFSFFAIVTSFLGVSLSLSDFLSDGLRLKETVFGRLMACFLTFIPPLIFLFTSKRAFILALEYAGALVGILLILFPTLMAWKLETPRFYRSWYGRFSMIFAFIFGLFIVSLVFIQRFGLLTPFIQRYVSS